MPIDTTLSVEGQAADAKAVGDAIAAIPQSDWNINDELNPAFIKNRPFYSGEVSEVEIIPYEIRTGTDAGEGIIRFEIMDISSANGTPGSFKVGQEYVVTIDGVRYVTVAKQGENFNYIGDETGVFSEETPFFAYGVDADMSMSGEPFIVFAIPTSDGSLLHAWGITTFEENVKTIDTKYLPEHLQFGETDKVTITTVLPYEEREFYYNAEEMGEVALYTDESFVPFEEGKVYHVTIDGVEYTCQSFCDVDNFGPMVILGSIELLTEGTAPNELPFVSYSAMSDDGPMFTFGFKSTSGGMHSFGIEVEETEIVKIDKKYLPDDLNKPDVVIFDKGDLISSYENSTSYACTCTHTREELLEIYEKLNVYKNQENTPKIIARLITDNDGDVYGFINYSASQRTSNSVQFFFDYTLNGHNYVILAGYAAGSFYWTESEYDTESKLREKQNKTLIVTGTCAELEDPNSEVELTLSHTWDDINTALSNNKDVEIHVDVGNTGMSVIVLKIAHYMPNAMAIFSCMVGQTLFTTSLSASGETPYLGGMAIALMAETEAALEEKQDKITGTAGDFVVIGEDGNVRTIKNDSNVFIIRFTMDAGEKMVPNNCTYEEIISALEAGKYCVAISNYDDTVYNLSLYQDGVLEFSRVGVDNSETYCINADNTASSRKMRTFATCSNYTIDGVSRKCFSYIIGANTYNQNPSISIFRNSKILSVDTTPTANGEINWTYK